MQSQYLQYVQYFLLVNIFANCIDLFIYLFFYLTSVLGVIICTVSYNPS